MMDVVKPLADPAVVKPCFGREFLRALSFLVPVFGLFAAIPLIEVGPPDFVRDLFAPSVPSKCSDFTPYTLNRVLSQAPLVKLTGMKVLEVLKSRDVGAVHSSSFMLSCDVDVLTNTGGEITVHAATRAVNGTIYILASLFDE
jgi:hypothetical protein